jgi:hypothetical protein
MAQRLLRAEVWSQHDSKSLHRVTARVIPSDVLDAPAVIAHARLVVLGGDDRRLHEEIVTAGGLLRDGRLSRFNVGQTEAVLRAQTDKSVPAQRLAELKTMWSRIREGVVGTLEARMRERTGGLERQLKEQQEREVTDLKAILDELARTIREELEAQSPVQPELPGIEKRQLEVNRQAIRARLEAIPGEIARETKQIRARYANPTPRLFPVAVTFLVPEHLAR